MKSFGPFNPPLFLGSHGATDFLIPRLEFCCGRNIRETKTPGGGTRPTGIQAIVGRVPPRGVSFFFHGIRSSEIETSPVG